MCIYLIMRLKQHGRSMKLRINQKYNGTIIGALCTLFSILLTFTFIIPIYAVMPGAILEDIITCIWPNLPFSSVGKIVSVIFLALLLIAFVLLFKKAQRKSFNNRSIFMLLFIESFALNPLVFYLYWWFNYNFRGDGQLVFLAFDTFLISSLGYVLIGVFVDVMKAKKERR